MKPAPGGLMVNTCQSLFMTLNQRSTAKAEGQPITVSLAGAIGTCHVRSWSIGHDM